MTSASILIIDDSPLNVTLLTAYLKTLGHHVTSAADGNEGMQFVQKQSFDLILLDWVMPEPDGAAVLKMLKNDPDLAQVPVILISSDTATETMNAMQRGQFFDYIHKPFDHQAVAEKIKLALRVTS